jgi:hypothetical protein
VKYGGRPYVPDQALFSLFYSPKLVEENSAKSAAPSNPSSALRAPNYEYGGPLAVLGEGRFLTPR